MDFLDPKKKRAHKIRLYVGYVLMAIAISFGTLILLLEAFGYDLYNRSGDVIQNGLVFVENKPFSADIYLDGTPEGRTGKRLVLPEGQYNIRLERDGYRPWARDFALRGASVERLIYPLLIPEELETENIKQFETQPQLVTQSLDRRWAVLLRPGSLRTFDVIDLNSANNAATVATLPQALVNTDAGQDRFEAIEWASDNRRVLIRHVFKGGHEFIVLDTRDPANSYNINQTFPISISQVSLRDKKFDQLYIRDGNNTLWSAVSSNAQLNPVADHVRAFKPHGSDVLLYVTDEEAIEGQVIVNLRTGSETYELRKLPKAKNYALDLARYDGQWLVVAGSSAQERAYVYRNPFEQLNSGKVPVAPISVLRSLNQQAYVSFSANSRFIGTQKGSEFSVYDAEHDRQYRFDMELNMSEGYKAVWADGYRYAVVNDGKVVMFDFDGSNRETLNSAYGAYLPMFRNDFQQLFTLSPSAGRPTLTRTFLIASQDR